MQRGVRLRLQPFSFRLPLEREINGYSCLNRLTNYIRLIYSIYTVIVKTSRQARFWGWWVGWRRRTTTNPEIERICSFSKLVVGGGGAEQPPTSKISRSLFSGLVVGGGRAEQPPTLKTSSRTRFRSWWWVIGTRRADVLIFDVGGLCQVVVVVGLGLSAWRQGGNALLNTVAVGFSWGYKERKKKKMAQLAEIFRHVEMIRRRNERFVLSWISKTKERNNNNNGRTFTPMLSPFCPLPMPSRCGMLEDRCAVNLLLYYYYITNRLTIYIPFNYCIPNFSWGSLYININVYGINRIKRLARWNGWSLKFGRESLWIDEDEFKSKRKNNKALPDREKQ